MSKIPRTPQFLGPHGRKFWRAVTEKWDLQIHEQELLGFAAGCLDSIAAARGAIARDGQFVKSDRGRTIVHPGVKIIRDAQCEFRLLCGRLKLTGV